MNIKSRCFTLSKGDKEVKPTSKIVKLQKLFMHKLFSSPELIIKILCYLTALIPLIFFHSTFLNKTDINTYAQRYANSQYVKGESSTQKISDGDLYVYAGYAYMQGEDPTTINFEHPPLIKYIYGLSYYIFGNSFIASLAFYFIFLFSSYLFSGLVIQNKFLRYLSVIILGIQPIVYVLSSHALLDLPMNFLLLFLFYFLFKEGIQARTRYAIAGIIIGLLSGVKYPIPFMFVPISMVVLTSFVRNEIKYLIYPTLITPAIYLAQYSMYFAHGHSLLDFIQFEKYRFSWWTGDRTMPKFLIFQNLFTGQYPAWWTDGTMMKEREWNIFIPTLFLFNLITFLSTKQRKMKVILFTYSITVLLLYGIGSAVYLRYLTQLIPFWIVITLSGIEEYLQNKKIFFQKLSIKPKKY